MTGLDSWRPGGSPAGQGAIILFSGPKGNKADSVLIEMLLYLSDTDNKFLVISCVSSGFYFFFSPKQITPVDTNCGKQFHFRSQDSVL